MKPVSLDFLQSVVPNLARRSAIQAMAARVYAFIVREYQNIT